MDFISITGSGLILAGIIFTFKKAQLGFLLIAAGFSALAIEQFMDGQNRGILLAFLGLAALIRAKSKQ